MLTSSTMYWITRLDSLCGLLLFFVICLSVSIIVTIISKFVRFDSCSGDEEDGVRKSMNSIIKKCTVSLILLCTLSTFIPSTKEAIAIYAIPKIANNEKLQIITKNGAELISLKLKEWIDEMMGQGESK